MPLVFEGRFDEEKEMEQAERLLSPLEAPPPTVHAKTWRRVAENRLPWLVHALMIMGYSIMFLYRPGSLVECDILQSTEIPSAKVAVQLEKASWTATDWSGNRRPNKFEGPPSQERDAAWETLVDVGMYSLTPEEYAMFPAEIETAEDSRHPGDHVVLIEMFHQLHCLHMLRSLIYDPERRNIYNETPDYVPLHIDHCIDYMRQTVMCHGDLTPILLKNKPQGVPEYFPDFGSPRTCRNFDLIYDWAVAGNRSGKHIEFP